MCLGPCDTQVGRKGAESRGFGVKQRNKKRAGTEHLLHIQTAFTLPVTFPLSSILHPLRPLPLLLHPYPPADPSRHFLPAKFISFLLHFADITTHPRTSQHPPPPLPLPLHYVIMIIAHRVWGNWIAYFALVALSHQFLSLCHLPIPPQSSAGADSAAWTLDQISP